MLKLGPLYIATRQEFDHAVIGLAVETASEHLDLVNQDLLRAAMAADAFVHEDAAHPLHEEHRRAVCEQLVAAIGPALIGNGS